MTEPGREPVRPDEETEYDEAADLPPPAGGCRRAGCGFLAGVVGTALVTVLVLAAVLTRGHPLRLATQLLGSGQGARTPATQAQMAPAVEVVPTPSEAAPTVKPATETVIPTPTFIPVPTAIPTNTPSPTPSPTPTPIIALRQVNQLGRYESMQFVIQTVVDLAREPNNFWERICGSDTLLLVAGGEVIAGFDLSKVKPGDLKVTGRSLTLALPPAEVFSYFVREDQTYVYQRNTGLLCRPDPNLETQARQQAEQRLLDYAMAQGILARAEKAGLTQLEAFFRDLGFDQVELTVKPGNPGD